MSVKGFARLVVAAVAVGFVLAGQARADKKQLQEKLNKNISIELEDVTIAEALKEIGQKAGLKIALSDEAVWRLPQGDITRLSVKLEGRLGDSMTEMLNAFFMRYAVGSEEITIYPRPELEHIIGRPSTKQLELLKNIYSGRVTFSQGFSSELVNSLIGKSMGVSFLPYDTPVEIYKILKASETDKGTSPTTLAVLLEQLGEKQQRPYWYISGSELPSGLHMIKMVYEEDFRQARLDQIIDVSFVDERADVVLQRLTSLAGMELIMLEPDTSWLEGTISANMQNTALKQALMNVISLLGGKYEIDTHGNYVRVLALKLQRPEPNREQKGPRNGGEADDAYVGKISIPMDGGRYFLEFMLRQSDLPEELKDFREQMIKEALGKRVRDVKAKQALKEAIEEAKEKAGPEETAEPAPQK